MKKSEKGFKTKNFIIGILVGIAVVFLISSLTAPDGEGGDRSNVSRVDDWQYTGPSWEGDFFGGLRKTNAVYSTGAAAPEAADSLGFSVGGAKDVNNYRDNIENDYLPVPTDLTYEGLFYDYFFDTGQGQECEKLFCPSYSYAVSRDPFSEKEEYYLSVGLNSNLKESDFQRKKLNLVIVLDISGSMGSPFNRYYYDQFGNQEALGDEEDWDKSKMQVASEAIVALTKHLNDDDRFGMVLFDDQAYLAKPLNPVGETDMEAIRNHIMELSPQGGTYMEAGMEKGTELFEEVLSADKSEYENRIIFLTDAMPNIGVTSEEGLLGMTRGNSEDGIYSTFIGIGVDFNTELTEAITKIRGANYYSVHSSSQFSERMDEGFEYMVTPLVFDLELKLEAEGYDIEKVYGSPEADEATGEIMKVNTLFPSRTEGGETKGGIVLLKLEKTSDEASLRLVASYEDREGAEDSDEKTVDWEQKTADYYANTGIRKGILLSRYADLMRNWMADEHAAHEDNTEAETRMGELGIIIPPEFELGKWERQSVPLQVSEEYESLFQTFSGYFESEMNAIGDDTLQQEQDILEKLSDY
jgi:Ca-activated chloride channel family protein